MLLYVSLLCVLIDLCGRQLQLDIDVTKLTILQHSKMGPVLTPEGNCTKPRHTIAADGVPRVMVLGQGRPTTGSGKPMVQLGRGPITYPTGQPSES
jgi:hypothetical protein